MYFWEENTFNMLKCWDFLSLEVHVDSLLQNMVQFFFLQSCVCKFYWISLLALYELCMCCLVTLIFFFYLFYDFCRSPESIKGCTAICFSSIDIHWPLTFEHPDKLFKLIHEPRVRGSVIRMGLFCDIVDMDFTL